MSDILPADEYSTEIRLIDGTFVKSFRLNAGMVIGQHAHTYAHVSVLPRGSVQCWRDGVLIGDYKAPTSILIPARAKHAFRALEDGTQILCVHDIATGEDVDIHEENTVADAIAWGLL